MTKQSLEDKLDDMHEIMTEQWLRKHLLSRFVRFIIQGLVIFIAVTGFVQTTARSACQDDVAGFKIDKTRVERSISVLEAAQRKGIPQTTPVEDQKTKLNFQAQLKLINKRVDPNYCGDQFPIFPGT